MSFAGEFLGYDSRGRDILGENENPDYNCIVCGLDALSHSQEQTVRCLSQLWREREGPEGGK